LMAPLVGVERKEKDKRLAERLKHLEQKELVKKISTKVL
jgi:hypothetical protein